MKKLSDKKRAILRFLRDFLERKGYPPSVREIQEACGISSTSVVDYNLRLLERDGYIHRDREVSRGIEMLGRGAGRPGVVPVPLLGAIAAGSPIPVPGADAWAVSPEEQIPVPESMLRGKEGVYALRVQGTSMIDALVNDGDLVLVQHQTAAQTGQMVVAWLKAEGETTLKRYYPEGERVRLQPANSTMEPIYVDARNLDIQGTVVGVLRDNNP
ncbi:MAG: transcriptional repressor LexA [Dehalococcoidia bacterium]